MKNKALEDIIITCQDCALFTREKKFPFRAFCPRFNEKIQISPASFVSDKTHYFLKVICKEFKPNADFYPWLASVWTCYDDYEYEHYGYDWICLLNADDPDWVYAIKNDDFINGRMEKMYRYRKIKKRRKNEISLKEN